LHTKQKRDLKFMKKKFLSLALLVTLSTAIASQHQITTEDIEFRQNILSLSESRYQLPIPTYTEWPPRNDTRQPLRLSELFSSDTGHTGIDHKAHELTHILLATEERIAKFRLLSEDTQIKTAVAFSRLACNIAGDSPGILLDLAFKKKCDELLSGKTITFVSAELVIPLFVRTAEGDTASVSQIDANSGTEADINA